MAGLVEQSLTGSWRESCHLGPQNIAPVAGDRHAVGAVHVGGGAIALTGEGVGGSDPDPGECDGAGADDPVDGAAFAREGFGLWARAGLRTCLLQRQGDH